MYFFSFIFYLFFYFGQTTFVFLMGNRNIYLLFLKWMVDSQHFWYTGTCINPHSQYSSKSAKRWRVNFTVLIRLKSKYWWYKMKICKYKKINKKKRKRKMKMEQ
jgi:hypothetical protein